MDPIKVLIEIPEGSTVKYEIDEATGELTVDRFMPTAMGYPINYGLIFDAPGEDGDLLDVLVFMSQPVAPGVVVRCNIIGMLEMEDEAGVDHKIVAVPVVKVDPICGTWKSLDDVPTAKKEQIRHFFEHYKDLEKDKFVKLKDYKGVPEAQAVLKAARDRFEVEMQSEDCSCEGCTGDCAHGECSCGNE